jgi:DNA invertase Pin-like site-specific DNA recombinase
MQRILVLLSEQSPPAGVDNLLLPGGKMDVTKILTELRQEREQIEEAIMSLERLARGRGRRRGRPPSWMAEIEKKRGRPPGSKNKPPAVQKAMGIV